MARVLLTPAEKEKRKLQRRATKKAKRAEVKAAVEVVEKTSTKKGKTSSAFHLIEIPMSDQASRMKLAELKEAGASITQVAYASGYLVYNVPTSITGYPKHGTSKIAEDKNVPAEKPLKTITDLVFVVSEKIDNKEKVNKRQIKLLVRGSELPRNKKKEAVDTLISKFKIK